MLAHAGEDIPPVLADVVVEEDDVSDAISRRVHHRRQAAARTALVALLILFFYTIAVLFSKPYKRNDLDMQAIFTQVGGRCTGSRPLAHRLMSWPSTRRR